MDERETAASREKRDREELDRLRMLREQSEAERMDAHNDVSPLFIDCITSLYTNIN